MHLKAIYGARVGSTEILEAKVAGVIVWPIYYLRVYDNDITIPASGGTYTFDVYWTATNEDDAQIRTGQLTDTDVSVEKITSLSTDPDNQISFSGLTFSADMLPAEYRREAYSVYRITWTAKGVSIDVTVRQAENTETITPEHLITTGFGSLVLTPVGEGAAITDVPVVGGQYTVTGTIVSNVISRRGDYASGAHWGGEVSQVGRIDEGVIPLSLTCSPAPASILGVDITFDPNTRNENDIYFNITAYYQNQYDPAPVPGTRRIMQEADYITGHPQEVNPNSYEAYVAIFNSQYLTPTGVSSAGTPTLQAKANHDERTNTVWASGAIDVGDWYEVADTFTASKEDANSSFTIGTWSGPDANGYYTAPVDHSNMRDRALDSVRFRVENDRNREAYWETSWIEIPNSATHHRSNVFSLLFEDTEIPYTGGNVSLHYVAVERDRITYDSLYEETVDAPLQVNLTTDWGSFSESAVGGEGDVTFTAPENNIFTARVITANMHYISSAVVATTTITQDANPGIYTLDLSESEWTFYANGSSPAGRTLTLHAYGVFTDGSGEHTTELSASDLTFTKTGDPNGRITRSGLDFSASDLGTTPYDAVVANYAIVWNAHPEATASIAVGQDANRIEETISPHTELSAFGSLVFSPSVISVTGGRVTVRGTASYVNVDYEYIWSSGSHSGGATTPAGTASVNAESVSCSGAYQTSGNALYFNGNEHNEDTVTYRVYATYEGITSSRNITQEEDTYTDTQNAHDYEASIALYGTNGLTAQGGSCTFSASAQHGLETTRTWDSDGYQEVVSDVTVSDEVSVTISGTGSGYFSISGNTISHDNMLKRSTDSATFTASNDSYPSATASRSVSISNGTSVSEFNTFSVDSDTATIENTGETVTITYISRHTVRTTYDSGSTTDVKTSLSSTLTASVGTLSSSGISGAGSVTLTVPANTAYTSRSVVVSLVYSGSTRDSVTMTQEAATRPLTDYIAVSDSPTSSGRTVYFTNNYSASLLVTVRLDFYDESDDTLYYTTQWTGRIAAGATASQSYPYGYGFYLESTVTSAQL